MKTDQNESKKTSHSLSEMHSDFAAACKKFEEEDSKALQCASEPEDLMVEETEGELEDELSYRKSLSIAGTYKGKEYEFPVLTNKESLPDIPSVTLGVAVTFDPIKGFDTVSAVFDSSTESFPECVPLAEGVILAIHTAPIPNSVKNVEEVLHEMAGTILRDVVIAWQASLDDLKEEYNIK